MHITGGTHSTLIQHITHQYTWTAESALRCPCRCSPLVAEPDTSESVPDAESDSKHASLPYSPNSRSMANGRSSLQPRSCFRDPYISSSTWPVWEINHAHSHIPMLQTSKNLVLKISYFVLTYLVTIIIWSPSKTYIFSTSALFL